MVWYMYVVDNVNRIDGAVRNLRAVYTFELGLMHPMYINSLLHMTRWRYGSFSYMHVIQLHVIFVRLGARLKKVTPMRCAHKRGFRFRERERE